MSTSAGKTEHLFHRTPPNGCLLYQTKKTNNAGIFGCIYDKYMHRNIPALIVFFVWHFPTLRCYFSDYCSHYKRLNILAHRLFPRSLGLKGRLSQKEVGLLPKCQFFLILSANSSKLDLSSGLLILFCIGAKSKPYSSTLISVLLKKLLPKLQTVAE